MDDLLAARILMASSLAWHIVLACLGVGFPVIILAAEGLGLRRDDAVLLTLARRWSKTLAVLFAVGAVSGTILSFELGILWPGLMGTYGEVIGLPFALEGFAFFLEAIFVGIYLYGWDRLGPRQHFLAGIPIVLAGTASAWFVVTANAWMNQPGGFTVVDGAIVDVDPWDAMLNPATAPQTTHMILAAWMVSGFVVAAFYARRLLAGRRDRYHRLGLLIPLAFAALVTPFQIGVGDWAAKFVAEYQPVKLAAMEGIFETRRRAPLHVGGLPLDGEVVGSIEIPAGLSWLAYGDPDAEVMGLEEVPEADRPPAAVVHVAFQVMVGGGFYLLALAGWAGVLALRRRAGAPPRSFLRAALVAGPLSVLAMEAGWVVTEVGRQPWIVWRTMRVSEAVTRASGIAYGLAAFALVFGGLTVALVFVLRRLAATPLPEELR